MGITVNNSKTITIPEGTEQTREYRLGVEAFMKGLNDVRDCPYPSNHAKSAERTRWMSGFWGEHVRQFLLRWESRNRKRFAL